MLDGDDSSGVEMPYLALTVRLVGVPSPESNCNENLLGHTPKVANYTQS